MDLEDYIDYELIKQGERRTALVERMQKTGEAAIPNELLIIILGHTLDNQDQASEITLGTKIDLHLGPSASLHLRSLARKAFWCQNVEKLAVLKYQTAYGVRSKGSLLQNTSSKTQHFQISIRLSESYVTNRARHFNIGVVVGPVDRELERQIDPCLGLITSALKESEAADKLDLETLCIVIESFTRDLAWLRNTNLRAEIKQAVELLRSLKAAGKAKRVGMAILLEEGQEAKLDWKNVAEDGSEDVVERIFTEVERGFWL